MGKNVRKPQGGFFDSHCRSRYRVQKCVTAIHRRKLVINCGARSSAKGTRMVWRSQEWGLGRGMSSPVEVVVWGSRKNFLMLSFGPSEC